MEKDPEDWRQTQRGSPWGIGRGGGKAIERENDRISFGASKRGRSQRSPTIIRISAGRSEHLIQDFNEKNKWKVKTLKVGLELILSKSLVKIAEVTESCLFEVIDLDHGYQIETNLVLNKEWGRKSKSITISWTNEVRIVSKMGKPKWDLDASE